VAIHPLHQARTLEDHWQVIRVSCRQDTVPNGLVQKCQV
jgi:hypothetical protein